MSPKESFWLGLKGGLLDAKHVTRMGMSIWLFGYLTRSQTALNANGEGVVNYGHALKLERISLEMKGVPKATIRRWIARLRREKYIRTEGHSNRGMTFWIAKGKNKTKTRRIHHDIGAKSAKNSVENLGAKMNGSLENSRTELHESTANSREILHGSYFEAPRQSDQSQRVAALSEAPTSEGFITKDLSYYNKAAAAKNAAVSSLSCLVKKKSFPRTTSTQELDARRRFLVKQGEEIRAKYGAQR